MSAMFPLVSHPLQSPLPVHPWLRKQHDPTTIEPALEHSKALITGDVRLYVSESEVALHPVTGHYSIETTGLQEPLYMLWNAEGQVLDRRARSASITFNVSGARAGETRTFLVAVQVMESGAQGRVVQSGMFVQVVVI
ncbi:MAG: hypothetical protein ACRDIV_05660 [Ktedonobacteraceae bacterium]